VAYCMVNSLTLSMVVRLVTAVFFKTVACWHFEESFRFHLQIRNHNFENSCLKEGGRSNLRGKTGIERDLGQIERLKENTRTQKKFPSMNDCIVSKI